MYILYIHIVMYKINVIARLSNDLELNDHKVHNNYKILYLFNRLL